MGFAEHLGLDAAQSDPGTGRVTLDAGPVHLNARGTVHGGVLAAMLDAAMAGAVRSSGGDSPVTVSLAVTYLEPGREGRLEAAARIRKRGKRLLVVEGEVTQDGDVVADALGTFSVRG